MIPSLILNAANIALVTGCLIWGIRVSDPVRKLFRYFTMLSNLLSAAASVVVVIAWLCGGLPVWVQLLKFAGTAAVTVTMLTVLLLLAPLSHEWKDFFAGAQFLMHLICPLLAIVSFLVFEKTRPMTAWAIAVGVAPVALYGILYWYKVIFVPEERKWPDIYSFTLIGKWPLICLLMLSGTALISLALWLI